MPNSSNSTSTKCFSGILRRLLCTGSHPTHPSDDQFIESSPKQAAGEYQTAEKSQKLEVQVNQAAADYSTTTTPGVVARLMGLDSLPKRDTTLGSYLRSKSVNSIDFISNFDLTKQGHNCQHRRVRTSVSFREETNDDYGAGLEYLKEEDLVIKKRPKVINYDQKEKNEKLQKKNVKNKPSKEIRPVCIKLSSEQFGNATYQNIREKSRVNLKEKRPIIKTVDGSNCMKKKRNKILNNYKVDSDKNRLKKVNIEATIQEVPRVSQSRKPLSSQIANSQTHFDNGEVRAIFEGKDGSEMKNEGSCYYKKMVEKICMLTKEDMKENWIYVKLEDFEETCQRFGQEILEVLLTQFVEELVLLYGTRELYI